VKIYEQRAIFYKHSKALFYPTSIFMLSQNISQYPIQLLESALYTTIVYWSVGMSSANNGGRFFTYYLILVMFTLTLHQFFRFLAAIASSSATALPIAGLILIIMVLFCG